MCQHTCTHNLNEIKLDIYVKKANYLFCLTPTLGKKSTSCNVHTFEVIFRTPCVFELNIFSSKCYILNWETIDFKFDHLASVSMTGTELIKYKRKTSPPTNTKNIINKISTKFWWCNKATSSALFFSTKQEKRNNNKGYYYKW